MSGKPIIMSPYMVLKILNDKKSVTRRVIKGIDVPYSNETYQLYNKMKPPYPVGSVMWVREKMFVDNDGIAKTSADGIPARDQDRYRNKDYCHKYPSIFMPQSEARLFLRVLSIIPMPLHAVSYGRWLLNFHNFRIFSKPESDWVYEGFDTLEEFIEFWNSIHKKQEHKYAFNPAVWRIEFQRMDCPEEYP